MYLQINCFNGMSYVINDSATQEDLSTHVIRMENKGYEISWLSPFQVEINSEEMVDDNMGVVTLSKVKFTE